MEELNIREDLLEAIEGFFGYMETLGYLSTQDLTIIAERLNLNY